MFCLILQINYLQLKNYSLLFVCNNVNFIVTNQCFNVLYKIIKIQFNTLFFLVFNTYCYDSISLFILIIDNLHSL